MASSDDFDRLRRSLGWLVPAVSTAIALAATVWLVRADGRLASDLGSIRADAAGALVEVPVLTHPVGPGAVLSDEDLEDRTLPAEYLTPTVARDREALVGRTVNAPILAGEAVREERLVDRDRGIGLDALVPNGMRALALTLPTDRQVSGFVRPGDRIDVLATLQAVDEGPEGAGSPAHTITVASGARVLAVDEWMSETAEGEPVFRAQLTVLVDPRTAERAAHVAAVARLAITLRSALDPLGPGDPASEAGSPGPAAPIGRASRRMSPVAFHAAFGPTEVDAMYARLAALHAPPPIPVDPHLLRDLPARPPREPDHVTEREPNIARGGPR